MAAESLSLPKNLQMFEPRCLAQSSWPWSLTAEYLGIWASPCWPQERAGWPTALQLHAAALGS